MRRLSKYQVKKIITTIFYTLFVRSVLTFCCQAWYNQLSISGKNQLHKIVKLLSKIIAVNHKNMEPLFLERAVRAEARITPDCYSEWNRGTQEQSQTRRLGGSNQGIY
jgi:hypothetical protein